MRMMILVACRDLHIHHGISYPSISGLSNPQSKHIHQQNDHRYLALLLWGHEFLQAVDCGISSQTDLIKLQVIREPINGLRKWVNKKNIQANYSEEYYEDPLNLYQCDKQDERKWNILCYEEEELTAEEHDNVLLLKFLLK